MADDLPSTKTPSPSKITVLISGSGTNLQALIDACSSGLLPSTSIIRVISNKKSAYGLERARSASIPTHYHNLVSGSYHRPGEKDAAVKAQAREKYDADLVKLIIADRPDMVVCAGWMHILSPPFLNPLAKEGIPVINLHPALPGEYDGVGAIQRAHADFESGKTTRTGVMIHYVIHEVDRGEPIICREVQKVEREPLEELEERIHAVEHELIVVGTGLALARLKEGERDLGTKAKT